MNLFKKSVHPHSLKKRLNLFALAAGLTIVSTQVCALDSDRDQPIEIESDRAEFRELDGLTVYSGNVRMSQGSILLMADEVSIHSDDGSVNRLVATGDRAYYEQLPSEGEDKIVAQGDTIEYVLAEDVINLISNASITQEGATLNGNKITYDVRNHLLTASKQPGNANTRVRVSIPSLNAAPSLDTDQ